MNEAPRFAWQRGAVRPIETCSVPLLDRGLLFGESIYEVLPVVAGGVRLLTEHMERMRAGAAELGLAAGLPSDEAVAALAAELVEADRLHDGILYMQLTGGAAAQRNVSPSSTAEPQLFAFVQSMPLPRGDDHGGARRVVTAVDPRWARCDLKTTMLLPTLLARRSDPSADEVVFFSTEGMLAEGGSTCVLIVEAGTVVLPPLTPRVLPSVTRRLLEEIAAARGVPMIAEPISRARMLAADEIGLASTTKLVLSVGRVDEREVRHRADGVCARLAAVLRERYGIE